MSQYKLLVLNTDEKEFSYGGVCPFMRNMHPYLQDAFELDYMVLPQQWKKLPGSTRVKYMIFLWMHRGRLKKSDFILSHGPEGSYVASYVGVPYAHIYHGNSNPMTISRFAFGKYFAKMYDAMFRRIDRTASLVYTVGPVRNEKQKKMYNPLNQNVKPLPMDERKGFIFAGRLEAMKNVDRLIRIYAKMLESIRSENPFYIAGYGSQEATLHKLMANLGFDDSDNGTVGKVVFLGKVDNTEMMQIIAEKKVLLMASSTEGMPTAIAEAFSVGVPVVCTGVGDIPNVVRNGYNGELLPLGFKDEDYIDALMKVMSNYETYMKNAFNASTIFNREKITHEVIEDIHQYLNRYETSK